MDVLRPLADAFVAHAYLVVFVGALIDATGLPFPGRLLLAGAGAYAAAGNASLAAFIALGALGAMLTDQVWFWTATRGGVWLIDTYRRLTRRPSAGPAAGADALVRYGPLSVVLGRFFTVVRLVAWPVLVRNGLSWPRFLILDALGAFVWSSIWVGLGWIVGERWQEAAQSASGWLAITAAVVVIALAGPVALRVWRRRTREGAAH
jgi:membrane protein DedA with SNARE-associated domain